MARLAALVLSDTERSELEALLRRRKTAQSMALRARIVLECATGCENKDVAARLRVDPATVGKWRRRFVERRLDGLYDEPRSGAPRTIDDARIEAVIVRTLESPPPGATHWSSRGMARASGLSVSSVQRIWRAFGLQPHRTETFKLSSDPLFVDKVRDVVGLYVAPPAHAVVLCVDEKSQIQALDRTQPLLPLGIGYVEGVTHDYVRHGTTTLFAALDIASGKVLTQCKHRHRHQEFLQFLRHIEVSVPKKLDVHLIVDNYAAHKHPKVRRWLAARPRFHVHYTPTYSSWLNQVEIWFNIITQRAIRRGTFRSVRDLVANIERFVKRYNRNCQPFAWTATPDSILEKIDRLCKAVAGTRH